MACQKSNELNFINSIKNNFFIIFVYFKTAICVLTTITLSLSLSICQHMSRMCFRPNLKSICIYLQDQQLFKEIHFTQKYKVLDLCLTVHILPLDGGIIPKLFVYSTGLII